MGLQNVNETLLFSFSLEVAVLPRNVFKRRKSIRVRYVLNAKLFILCFTFESVFSFIIQNIVFCFARSFVAFIFKLV